MDHISIGLICHRMFTVYFRYIFAHKLPSAAVSTK